MIEVASILFRSGNDCSTIWKAGAALPDNMHTCSLIACQQLDLPDRKLSDLH